MILSNSLTACNVPHEILLHTSNSHDIRCFLVQLTLSRVSSASRSFSVISKLRKQVSSCCSRLRSFGSLICFLILVVAVNNAKMGLTEWSRTRGTRCRSPWEESAQLKSDIRNTISRKLEQIVEEVFLEKCFREVIHDHITDVNEETAEVAAARGAQLCNENRARCRHSNRSAL